MATSAARQECPDSRRRSCWKVETRCASSVAGIALRENSRGTLTDGLNKNTNEPRERQGDRKPAKTSCGAYWRYRPWRGRHATFGRTRVRIVSAASAGQCCARATKLKPLFAICACGHAARCWAWPDGPVAERSSPRQRRVASLALCFASRNGNHDETISAYLDDDSRRNCLCTRACQMAHAGAMCDHLGVIHSRESGGDQAAPAIAATRPRICRSGVSLAEAAVCCCRPCPEPARRVSASRSRAARPAEVLPIIRGC